MSIPRQVISVRDPGIGVAPAAINAVVYLGRSSLGTDNTLYVFSNVADAVDTLGQGPLVEDLCYHLTVAGGPVYAIKVAGTPGKVSTGGVTKTQGAVVSSGTVTVDGVPFDAYNVSVQIMKAGTNGAAEFVYTLDNGYTLSPQLVVPAGGAYTIPNTGLTLTFTPGSGSGTPQVFFGLGDKFTFTTDPPSFGTVTLNDGIQALINSSLEVAYIVLSGEFPDGGTAVAVYGALVLHAQSLFNQFRYVRIVTDAGTGTPEAIKTAFASAPASARLCVCYGDAAVVSAKPFQGFSVPKRSIVQPVAARCANILPSTDPARNADGALQGVLAISHDEFRQELMDASKFTTLRTWQGARGFYVTNARFMSPIGSDYEFWQHGRLMDIACDTAYKAQIPFLNSLVRLKPDNTISDADADRWEAQVTAALNVNLIEPDNAEGTAGHVNALSYGVDRLKNVLLSKTIYTKVAIQPLGYAKRIVTELGFSANVGG